jgi:hypothetical protein
MEERRTVSLPVACRETGCTRATGERIVQQYAERLPKPERVGITRVWPWDFVAALRVILEEEGRLRESTR